MMVLTFAYTNISRPMADDVEMAWKKIFGGREIFKIERKPLSKGDTLKIVVSVKDWDSARSIFSNPLPLGHKLQSELQGQARFSLKRPAKVFFKENKGTQARKEFRILLSTPLSKINELPPDMVAILNGGRKYFLGDIVTMSTFDLFALPGFGRKYLIELDKVLARYELFLASPSKQLHLQGWRRPVGTQK